jgi:hypothetical protein
MHKWAVRLHPMAGFGVSSINTEPSVLLPETINMLKENMNSHFLAVGASSSLLLSSLLLSGSFFRTGGGFGGDFTCWGLWGGITGGFSESSLLLSSELESL